MPLARLAARLVREEQRQEEEEARRRHELWSTFVALFFAHRGEAEPPMTKEEYRERQLVQAGKKKPAAISEQEWYQQERARKSWDELRKTYFKAASSPWHWEEAMGFTNHLFPEPEEAEDRVLTAAEYRDLERDAERSFIEALRAQVEGRRPTTEPI